METAIVKGMGKCPKLPWMIEFHTTADGKVFNNQLKAAFAPNYLEHLSALQPKSKVGKKRLTQFVVALPPRINRANVEEFLKVGMTVAVIRLDYFKTEDIPVVIELINECNEEFGKKVHRVYPLSIAIDVPQPGIRTGKLEKSDVELEKGQTTKVVTDPIFKNRVSKDYIYADYGKLPEVIGPGDSIFLGDDIEMSAYQIVNDIVMCIVERAGKLVDNMTLTLPNAPLVSTSEMNIQKIFEDIKGLQVDIVFVGPKGIEHAKNTFGASVMVFAKIENYNTFKTLDTYIDKVDGILIDGDKLLASSKENVFLVQKSIVAICNKKGIPVLASINCHSMTKSQIDDIANTVIDGVDALLLPPDVDLLESISAVCKSAEGAVYQKQIFTDLVSLFPPPIEPIVSTAIAAVQASFNSNAAAIIVVTTSGRSAKLISRFRPRCPIIALTRFGRIAKQLMIHRGIIPIFYVRNNDDSFARNTEKRVQLGMTFGKLQGYIRMGDAVVIVFGFKNYVGFRNCVEVVFASEFDTVPDEQEDE